MYRTPCVNVKVERGLKYVRTHVKITRQWKSTLVHLRAYARENYKTAEEHGMRLSCSTLNWFSR